MKWLLSNACYYCDIFLLFKEVYLGFFSLYLTKYLSKEHVILQYKKLLERKHCKLTDTDRQKNLIKSYLGLGSFLSKFDKLASFFTFQSERFEFFFLHGFGNGFQNLFQIIFFDCHCWNVIHENKM